jgi:hypothetical protein
MTRSIGTGTQYGLCTVGGIDNFTLFAGGLGIMGHSIIVKHFEAQFSIYFHSYQGFEEFFLKCRCPHGHE